MRRMMLTMMMLTMTAQAGAADVVAIQATDSGYTVYYEGDKPSKLSEIRWGMALHRLHPEAAGYECRYGTSQLEYRLKGDRFSPAFTKAEVTITHQHYLKPFGRVVGVRRLFDFTFGKTMPTGRGVRPYEELVRDMTDSGAHVQVDELAESARLRISSVIDPHVKKAARITTD